MCCKSLPPKVVRKQRPVVRAAQQEPDYEDLYLKLTAVFWGFFWLIGTFAEWAFKKGREAARRPRPAFWRSIIEG